MIHVYNPCFSVKLLYNRQVTPPITIISYNYFRINMVVVI